MLMMLGLASLLRWCWVKRKSPDVHDGGLASLLLWCSVKRGSPDAHDAGACLPPAVVLGETGNLMLMMLGLPPSCCGAG